MTRNVPAEMFPPAVRFIFPIFKFMTRPDGDKSARKASRSSVYLASSPEVEGVSGKYFGPDCKQVDLSPAVYDDSIRKKLWLMAQTIAKTTS